MRSDPFPARQAGSQARVGRVYRTALEPASTSPTCTRYTARTRSSTSKSSAAHITSPTRGLKTLVYAEQTRGQTPLYVEPHTRRAGNDDCVRSSGRPYPVRASHQAGGSGPREATPTRSGAQSTPRQTRPRTRHRHPDAPASHRAGVHRRRRAIEPRLALAMERT